MSAKPGQGKTFGCERVHEKAHSNNLCPECDKDMEELVFDAIDAPITGSHQRQLETALDSDGFETSVEVALPEGGYQILETIQDQGNLLTEELGGLTEDDRETAAYHMGMMGM